MSSENFLSRWSKRKQAARAAEQPEDMVSLQGEFSDAAPQATASVEPGEGIPPAEAELSAEEIAALPPIDELTAETDISVFLRKSVPAPLRNAALRRAWALDPKIRDFIGDAREYAYDWNTPGGVPGSGPLPASEEIARMAARIVGGEEPEADLQAVEKPRLAADARSNNREQLSSEGVSKAGTEVVPPQENRRSPHEESPFSQSAEAPRVVVPRCQSEADKRQESTAPTEQPSVHEPGTDASPRRHGGAMPV
jgi:Protein of unknown function (DUF3306)